MSDAPNSVRPATTVSLLEPSISALRSGDSDNTIYYSYSTLNNQAVCPARNYFKKLARQKLIEEDISLPLIFGSAIHSGIEECLKNERDPRVVANEYLAAKLEEKNFNGDKNKDYIDRYRFMNQSINNFLEKHHAALREEITDPESQIELWMESPWRKGILVGKVDVALPGIFGDWKTGKVPANQLAVEMSPQSSYYWKLAHLVGMEVPETFKYIYLRGVNKAKKINDDGKAVTDKSNPMIVTDFNVKMTAEKVEAVFKNHIEPLAKAYEEGVVYKNPSLQNCSTCTYRTACLNTDLPKITD